VSDTADFIKNDVYPLIDAVAAGWLDSFNPKRANRGHAYSLDCPQCQKPQRGFYYPGSGYVVCNRKNECLGKDGPTSLWSILSKLGHSKGEIFNMLCAEANVTPPSLKNNSTANVPSPMRSSKAIIQVTRKLAKDNQNIMSAFARERKFTEKEMLSMDLGYYPSSEVVLRELKAINADIDDCVRLGYLADEKGWDAFKGRIVGFWKQSDLTVRLWGRSPSKDSPEHKKKYQFTLSQSKSYPYLLDQYCDGPVVAVEGVFDAWAVRFAGEFRGIGIGGSLINPAQCEFLVKAGVNEVTHMIDPDSAGLQGALASIKNGSGCGLRVRVGVLPRNLGDPDELRSARRFDVIKSSVEKSYSPGEFVARYFIKEAEAGDAFTCRLAMKTYRSMLNQDQIQFRTICSELGHMVRPETDAIKALSSLLDSGMEMDEATAFIKRKFKFIVSVEHAL
jgi:DNA primase